MFKKIIVLLPMCFFALSNVNAQDVIYKKGGEKIKCKVTQIMPDEVSYKILDEVDGPTYTIEKQKIIKIVFASGRVETYTTNASMNEPELYIGQLKKLLK